MLLVLMAAPLAHSLSAPPLSVRIDGDFVHINAPEVHFLSGTTLERLKDGNTVGLLGQLSVSLDGNATVNTRSIARFALSYDIWEEKFSVTRISAMRMQQNRQTISHLSLDAAQNWIVDNLTLNTSSLPQDRPFWVRFDLRAEDPHDQLDIINEGGINIKRLVEIFSRPPRAAQPHWTVDAGPLHFADLHTTHFTRPE